MLASPVHVCGFLLQGELDEKDLTLLIHCRVCRIARTDERRAPRSKVAETIRLKPAWGIHNVLSDSEYSRREDNGWVS